MQVSIFIYTYRCIYVHIRTHSRTYVIKSYTYTLYFMAHNSILHGTHFNVFSHHIVYVARAARARARGATAEARGGNGAGNYCSPRQYGCAAGGVGG